MPTSLMNFLLLPDFPVSNFCNFDVWAKLSFLALLISCKFTDFLPMSDLLMAGMCAFSCYFSVSAKTSRT